MLRVLVTGSSGRLGKRLIDALANRGHEAVGLDLVARRSTDVIASILDRDSLATVMRDGRFDGVIHCAALHRPQLASRSAEFAGVNVVGTRNLLELATAAGIPRFVYTSTTAVMTDLSFAPGTIRRAHWLTEETEPRPSDIYGQTKLAAEAACHEWHARTGMNIVILRPARFFHRDLLEHSREFTQANHRANEFLNRRASVDDVATAHALALEKADDLKHDLMIVSAPSPFELSDCQQLIEDTPAVVERYFPDYEGVYARRGWKMYPTIDRVYVLRRAQEKLGLKFRETFGDQLL